jgi:hypothetical protein
MVASASIPTPLQWLNLGSVYLLYVSSGCMLPMHQFYGESMTRVRFANRRFDEPLFAGFSLIIRRDE